MLTPQQLTEAVETLYPALDELNQWITMDMVRRFMARLGRGEDAVLSGTDRWQTEVYQAAGGHLEDLKKRLQTLTKQTDAEIASIFEDAAVKAWAADCTVYAAAGREVKPLALSDRMVKILEDAYTRTQGEVHNFTRSTASASQKRLFKVLDESYFKIITGAQSYTAAVQEGVDELVKHQTRVVYPTGHTDTLETAVLRAVRTGVSQATGNMSLQSMIDHDWDLIRVSEHLGARYGDGGQNPGNHYWWQGKLYSRTGRTPGYPLFIPSVGFGTGEGLGGYNCRHSFGPGDPNHNPYEHFDEEENRRVYDLTQKQRAKESHIRREKLEVVGYREAARNAPDGELRAALEEKALRAENRVKKHTQQYEQFCRDNDLKPLNDRLYVARRSQAAAPKAAREMPVVSDKKEWLLQEVSMENVEVTKEAAENVKSFSCKTLNETGQEKLQAAHKELLAEGAEQELGVEVGRVFGTDMKPLSKTIVGIPGHIELPDPDVPYIAAHTHPDCNIFSPGDLSRFVECKNMQMLTADCHNGHVFAVEKTEAYDADVAGTLISDLNETYKLIKKQLEDGEIEGKEAIESIDFAVRMCLNELQGYGVNFYE